MEMIQEVSDWMLSTGKSALTTAEIAQILNVPPTQVRNRVRRELVSGKLFSPSRGLWVPIPPQFRNWGSTPAEEFIDPMMKYLGREYYVGWLSAAEYHGSAHQKPQTTQIAVSKQLGELRVGRVRIKFYSRAKFPHHALEQRTVRTGRAYYSNLELTLLDLSTNVQRAGGLNNLATVIHELATERNIRIDTLLNLAEEFPVSSLRRLGFIMQNLRIRYTYADMKRYLEKRVVRDPSLLLPSAESTGRYDNVWRIDVNAEIDADL